jgi:hypothetical protein
VDHAGLQSICAREHMCVVGRALECIRAPRIHLVYVPVCVIVEDKARLAQRKARCEELGHVEVDRARKMVVKVVQLVLVRRQD